MTAEQRKFVRYVRSTCVTLLVLYVPFTWLVLMDYPWNDHRWYMIRRWPILPGFSGGNGSMPTKRSRIL